MAKILPVLFENSLRTDFQRPLIKEQAGIQKFWVFFVCLFYQWLNGVVNITLINTTKFKLFNRFLTYAIILTVTGYIF